MSSIDDAQRALQAQHIIDGVEVQVELYDEDEEGNAEEGNSNYEQDEF